MEQPSTKTEQKELLQSQNSAENGTENKELSGKIGYLIQRETYKGLDIVGINENKWFASMAMYKFTDDYKTKEELIEYIDDNTFKICAMIAEMAIKTRDQWDKE